ncbi:MAG: CxxC-x17-CxxC domain-containing protein, partial [Patescibacteria group bacterium]
HNKLGQFVSNPIIRNIIGKPKSSFDIRKIIDEKKILVMNLSKGKVGEDNMRLLGGMLITKLYLAAMGRVDIPEEERNDFYLYVDEFQNFATESFADILSEARKYRLNLILAHQYIAQMDEKVQDAVFGNVGTMMTFRVGAADAEILEKEFNPEFMVNDIVNLGMGTIYLKLLINGIASRPFSAATLPPLPKQESSYKEEIIKVSREQFGAAKEGVEETIKQWYGEQAESVAQAVEAAKPKRPLYDAVCSKCGQKTQVIFQPDGKRPVFCQTCLEKIRAAAPTGGKGGPSVILPSASLAGGPRSSEILREKGRVSRSFSEVGPRKPAVREFEKPSKPAAISLNDLKKPAEEKKHRKGPDLGGLRDALKNINK